MQDIDAVSRNSPVDDISKPGPSRSYSRSYLYDADQGFEAHDKLKEVEDSKKMDGALTLHDVIMELSSQTSGNGIQQVQVRRENVLDDMIREVGKKSFNCNCSNMKTWFVGELGIDYGGLTRELWSLLAKEIKFKLCTGKSPNMSLKPNPMKLQEEYFRKIGLLMGLSFIHGGSGFPFFTPEIYRYISKSTGCIPGNSVQESSHVAIKAELDDVIVGLADAGVLNAIRDHSELFKRLFVYQNDPLTADQVIQVFARKVFSSEGSNDLQREKTTYIYFTDLLEEMEEGDLSLALRFFTGSERIPPEGFAECTLYFNANNKYPTASTCGSNLTLPTKYVDKYEEFKRNMIYGFKHNRGYGYS
ncbi:E3 ubiquitin-protein ligase Itchy homolog isoform X2 [Dysidea avara]